MFDMRALTPRYFELRLPNGLRIEVEPPKLKVLKKLFAMAKVNVDSENLNDEIIDVLAECLSRALSKNKQGKKITSEFIIDNLGIDEIQTLLTEYFKWVGEIKNSKN